MMKKKTTNFITVNIPSPRIYPQDSPCDINKRRYKSRMCRGPASKPIVLKKYAVPNISKLNDCEELLLTYRLYQKSVAKIVRKQHLAIELEKKYNVLHTELRNRLHIDDPTDDVRAVTDTDSRYFRYLNDHPRTKCIPLYKSLKFIYGKQMSIRQEVGYRQDNVLNIDTNHKRQLKKYHNCVQMHTNQVFYFEKFISEDYEKSIACLRKSESLYSNLIDAKTTELKRLASEQFSIQSRLIGIDYLYYQQRKYGRFLYYVSPPSWRAKHREFASSIEIETKGFDLGTSSEEETFNVVFENMKNECASGLIKPALYFSQPDELMTIFESTEKQQLNHFTHVAQLRPHAENLGVLIRALKRSVQKDSEFVAHIIEDIGHLLDADEERASELESKFIKILYGTFYDGVAATDVLQLQMNLEWCYERLFWEKPHSSIFFTAKAVEEMYMEYSNKLDAFSNVEAKAALKLSVKEEKEMMLKAKTAAKELRLFERLEKSLMRAHSINKPVATPAAVVRRYSIRKVKKEQEKTVVKRSSQRELTEAEIEYLHLFTNWTENDNPAKYLQSF